MTIQFRKLIVSGKNQGSDEGALRILDLRGIGRNQYKKRFPHRFLPSLGAILGMHAACQADITVASRAIPAQAIENEYSYGKWRRG
jgi:hypothetical protein